MLVRIRCGLSCGELLTPRTTRLGITGWPLGGVDIDDASEDVSEANGFVMATGTEGTRSGVRGVRGVG